VNQEEEYLRNAKDAQEWADRAATEEDRRSWLKIAQGWLSLFTRWTAEQRGPKSAGSADPDA
jgi:hypothetical protein